MRLTNTLISWLKQEEWEEVPKVDEENQETSTGFEFGIDDFSLKCYFEANEQTEVFKFYMYFFNTKVPEKNLDEIQKLVNIASLSMLLGNIQLLRDERTIRYYNSIDVEDAAFEPAHISNMLSAGVSAMKLYLPKYMAICFGGKTAEQALAEEE